MSIFITGDIHGGHDIHKLNTLNLRKKDKIKTGDTLIICGDFGLVFDLEESPEERYWLNWLDSKPWTTLFVDGNHENFHRLKTYPVQRKWGGQVQQISQKVFHLMRGEIYQIEDQKSLPLAVLLVMIERVALKMKAGGRRNYQVQKNVSMRGKNLPPMLIKSILSSPMMRLALMQKV